MQTRSAHHPTGGFLGTAAREAAQRAIGRRHSKLNCGSSLSLPEMYADSRYYCKRAKCAASDSSLLMGRVVVLQVVPRRISSALAGNQSDKSKRVLPKMDVRD